MYFNQIYSSGFLRLGSTWTYWHESYRLPQMNLPKHKFHWKVFNTFYTKKKDRFVIEETYRDGIEMLMWESMGQGHPNVNEADGTDGSHTAMHQPKGWSVKFIDTTTASLGEQALACDPILARRSWEEVCWRKQRLRGFMGGCFFPNKKKIHGRKCPLFQPGDSPHLMPKVAAIIFWPRRDLLNNEPISKDPWKDGWKRPGHG